MISIADRFWAKVNMDGPTMPGMQTPCWVWKAYRTPKGYGVFAVRYRENAQAHRVAFFLERGRWPNPCALHRCDFRACVRPDHIFEGTQAMNMADMDSKRRRRAPAGEAHCKTKLTRADVDTIRGMRGVVSCRELGQVYGVSFSTISKIQLGKVWAHNTPGA